VQIFRKDSLNFPFLKKLKKSVFVSSPPLEHFRTPIDVFQRGLKIRMNPEYTPIKYVINFQHPQR
jgi:hypothetical protein